MSPPGTAKRTGGGKKQQQQTGRKKGPSAVPAARQSTGAYVASDDSNDDDGDDHSSTAAYGRNERNEEDGNNQSSGDASDGTGEDDGGEEDGYGANAGGEPVYEVEKILDERRRNRRLEYHIQWKGYTETTWEPKSCLKTCDDLLAEFLAAKKTKKEEKRARDEKKRASMSSKASPKPRTPASAVSVASADSSGGGSKGPTPRTSRSSSVTPHVAPARPRRQSSVDRSLPPTASTERLPPTNPDGFAFTSTLAKRVNSQGKRSLAAMGASSGGVEWEDVVEKTNDTAPPAPKKSRASSSASISGSSPSPPPSTPSDPATHRKVELVNGEEIQLSDTVRIESVDSVERGADGPVATINFSDGRVGKVGTSHLITHDHKILVHYYEHYLHLFP